VNGEVYRRNPWGLMCDIDSVELESRSKTEHMEVNIVKIKPD
jgi:hypothetical protein